METPMKTYLLSIALVVGMVFATQAFAQDDATQCPHMVWKNGHYVCDADNS